MAYERARGGYVGHRKGGGRNVSNKFFLSFPFLHSHTDHRPPYPYPGVPVRYGTGPPPGVFARTISWNVAGPPTGVAIRCTGGVAIRCTGVAILCTGVPVRCIGSTTPPYAKLGPGLVRPEVYVLIGIASPPTQPCGCPSVDVGGVENVCGIGPRYGS